jgi:hypothetical protein
MSNFIHLDLVSLITVTGGEDTGTFGPGAGPNRTKAEGQLSVETPVGIKVTGNGKYESAESNYGLCMSKQPKGTSGEQMAKNCNPLAGTPGN